MTPLLTSHYDGIHPMNFHIKSIIKKDKCIEKEHGNFHFMIKCNSYTNNFKKIDNVSSFLYCNYDLAYIKHYYNRNLKEFYDNKSKKRPNTININYFAFQKNIENFTTFSLTNQLLQYSNINLTNLNNEKYKNKKILIKNETKLLPFLKQDLNIVYCGNLKNNLAYIEIANYNECFYKWILPEYFSNV